MVSDAKVFWEQRGQRGDSALSVTPGATSERRVAWARARLQNWTLERLHRHARFDHYVDLGCGFGDFTAVLGREARRITACDVSPEFVEAARSRLAAIGRTDARVDVSDVRSFVDYQDASIIYFGGVMTYLDDDGVRSVLQTASERLTPGGIIAARDWCAVRFGRETTNQQPWFSVHRRPESYVRLFREAGFELVEEASSLVMYAEQVVREGLHNEPATAVVAWLPKLLASASLSLMTRCSVSFVYRRM